MSPLCTQKRTFINHCYRLIYDCAPWSPALIVGNVSSVAGFGHGNGNALSRCLDGNPIALSMSNIKIIEKSWMDSDSHLVVQMLFLSEAPKVSVLATYDINVSYHANSVKLFNQLE
jgi:hypothetical protein